MGADRKEFDVPSRAVSRKTMKKMGAEDTFFAMQEWVGEVQRLCTVLGRPVVVGRHT